MLKAFLELFCMAVVLSAGFMLGQIYEIRLAPTLPDCRIVKRASSDRPWTIKHEQKACQYK